MRSRTAQVSSAGRRGGLGLARKDKGGLSEHKQVVGTMAARM